MNRNNKLSNYECSGVSRVINKIIQWASGVNKVEILCLHGADKLAVAVRESPRAIRTAGLTN